MYITYIIMIYIYFALSNGLKQKELYNITNVKKF